MTRSPPQRTLARVLESDAQMAEWSSRQRHEVAMTRLVRSYLPRPIGERVRITDTRGGVLEIAAGAGAIAAAIRQRVPDIRARLARDGHVFGEVRVRVQVGGHLVPAPDASTRQWNSTDAAPLFELADRLPDGPLKAALARWSRRARGR